MSPIAFKWSILAIKERHDFNKASGASAHAPRRGTISHRERLVFSQLKKIATRTRSPFSFFPSSIPLSTHALKTHLTNQRRKAESAIAPRATATWERTAAVIFDKRGKGELILSVLVPLYNEGGASTKRKSESTRGARRRIFSFPFNLDHYRLPLFRSFIFFFSRHYCKDNTTHTKFRAKINK